MSGLGVSRAESQAEASRIPASTGLENLPHDVLMPDALYSAFDEAPGPCLLSRPLLLKAAIQRSSVRGSELGCAPLCKS